jgi:rare lipoprotein A
MKSIVLAVVVALTALSVETTPASAWWDEVIAATKKQNGQTSASTSARSTKRTARAQQNTDDGSRPQRQASRPEPSGSLSGGETGVASYYWQPQRVASGGWFNPDAWTAAHKSLPFGTRVRVTRLDNGNSVDVTINDRGPYVAGRIIDLSRRAAQAIGMTGQGIARVRVAVVGR